MKLDAREHTPIGKYPDGNLHLGVQTNPPNVTQDAHKKAHSWAPKRAKSYNITITNTDYHGRPSKTVTGYASVVVEYFSTAEEGAHPIQHSSH